MSKIFKQVWITQWLLGVTLVMEYTIPVKLPNNTNSINSSLNFNNLKIIKETCKEFEDTTLKIRVHEVQILCINVVLQEMSYQGLRVSWGQIRLTSATTDDKIYWQYKNSPWYMVVYVVHKNYKCCDLARLYIVEVKMLQHCDGSITRSQMLEINQHFYYPRFCIAFSLAAR